MIKNKHIPLIKPSLPPKEEYEKMLDRIWEDRILSNRGPYHNEFMGKVSNYLDVEYSYPYVNGTIALETAIKILGIKGKEIITTPFTYVATTLAIMNTGNIPVFVDINPYDGNITSSSIKESINENTAAILPVHIYGVPCDIDDIEEIAKENDLYTIYDAAQAFGVKYNGMGIGNFGDLSIFSMHATKTFNTIEGGLICTNNPDMNRIVHLSCNFGMAENYDLIYSGSNGKFNEFQAAMGLLQLKYVDDNIKKRKNIVDVYKKYLDDDIVFTKFDDSAIKYNYTYFIIVHPKRDMILDELMKKNISSRKYFYPLTSDYSLIKDEYGKINLKNAKHVSERILAVPVYPELTEKEVKKICHIINDTIENK